MNMHKQDLSHLRQVADLLTTGSFSLVLGSLTVTHANTYIELTHTCWQAITNLKHYPKHLFRFLCTLPNKYANSIRRGSPTTEHCMPKQMMRWFWCWVDWLDRMKSLAGIRYTAPCRTCRVYVAYPKTWFDKVQNTRYLRCFLPDSCCGKNFEYVATQCRGVVPVDVWLYTG